MSLAMTPPLVVCYGAGVDSTAMLVGMAELGYRPDLILFANTGGERPETMAHLNAMSGWLRAQGFPPVTEVRNEAPRSPYSTLEGALLHTRTLPPPAFGYKTCSQRWKIAPQEKYLEHWEPARAAWSRGDRVVTAIGYDADETERSYSAKDTDHYQRWLPLREWRWNRERCQAEIAAAGLPVPPKSACFFCPYSKEHEIRDLAERHPDLWQRALRIERAALASGKIRSESVKGLGRRFAWSDLAPRGQLAMFEEAEAA